MLKKIKLLVNKEFLNLKYRKAKSQINSLYISKDIIIGRNVTIGKKVVICDNCSIGDFSYINSDYNYAFIDTNVSIGKFCSIGPNVQIGYGNHNKNYVSTHPLFYSATGENNFDKFNNIETIIGNDVWIGANANIKKGIKVGDGAIIGMNAVVTKDVPSYAIVAGVPAKIISYRFDEKKVQQLDEIKWWNLDFKKIEENKKYFNNVDLFLDKIKAER